MHKTEKMDAKIKAELQHLLLNNRVHCYASLILVILHQHLSILILPLSMFMALPKKNKHYCLEAISVIYLEIHL